MPRAKRQRRQSSSPARTQEPLSNTDQVDEERGRSRSRGSLRNTLAAAKLSLGDEDAIRKAKQRRDAALDRLANEDATTATSEAPSVDTMRMSIEVGRRAAATPMTRHDITGLDLADDDVFGDLEDSFGDGDITTGNRSVDSSVLTLNYTKASSRQSSFVGRTDGPIRPSSRGPTTPGVSSSFNIGLFRRRVREPSILGTSRKPSPQRGSIMQDLRMESDVEGSEPEDESTPLKNQRRTRKESSASEASLALSSSHVRQNSAARGGQDDAQVEPAVESHASLDVLPDAQSDSELSELNSSSPPPIGLEQRPITPETLAEITAPPASTDSEGEMDVWPDITKAAKRRKQPPATAIHHGDDVSDVSSPPSLTHSPNRVSAKAPRRRGKDEGRHAQSPNTTTADLISLMPKRHCKRARDEDDDSQEELDTTGLDNDQDELSWLSSRATRRRKDSQPPSRTASARPTSCSHASVSAKQPPQSLKTYARRSSNKENQSDDDDDDDGQGDGDSSFAPLANDTFDSGSGQQPQEAQSKPWLASQELERAKKYFEEVDKFNLTFAVDDWPSSPSNAR
ncbi:hypothetical protein CDD81_7934 [Ophiocordyceps australis]|uniref:Uncharacterized protein n=1 Tax=Ophiocordyceps australis TaxID=1399860 RepID=A0A2C5Y4M8_9HYPO|nr:hypothetical protein CDD81_7934 [Ophiocordyceps australis]